MTSKEFRELEVAYGKTTARLSFFFNTLMDKVEIGTLDKVMDFLKKELDAIPKDDIYKDEKNYLLGYGDAIQSVMEHVTKMRDEVCNDNNIHSEKE